MRVIILLFVFLQFIITPTLLVVMGEDCNLQAIQINEEENKTNNWSPLEEKADVQRLQLSYYFFNSELQTEGRFHEFDLNLIKEVDLKIPTPPPDFI